MEKNGSVNPIQDGLVTEPPPSRVLGVAQKPIDQLSF